MRRYTWIVLTNCDPDHEPAFNEWYDGTHIDDLLRVPGIVSAKRSRLTDPQMVTVKGELVLAVAGDKSPRYRYLATYEIHTDDISRVLEEIRARSGTREMEISPYLTEVYTALYESL